MFFEYYRNNNNNQNFLIQICSELLWMVMLCWVRVTFHSSEKRGLYSTFCPLEMLQNLPCLCKKKIHVASFVFHFEQLWFVFLGQKLSANLLFLKSDFIMILLWCMCYKNLVLYLCHFIPKKILFIMLKYVLNTPLY